jgi:hypothetical protein
MRIENISMIRRNMNCIEIIEKSQEVFEGKLMECIHFLKDKQMNFFAECVLDGTIFHLNDHVTYFGKDRSSIGVESIG